MPFKRKISILWLLKVQSNVKKVVSGFVKGYEKPVTVTPIFFQTFLLPNMFLRQLTEIHKHNQLKVALK